MPRTGCCAPRTAPWSKRACTCRTGRTLFKVSTCYERNVALRVCLERGELTEGIRVQEYAAERVRHLRMANKGMVDRYHQLLDAQREPGGGLL